MQERSDCKDGRLELVPCPDNVFHLNQNTLGPEGGAPQYRTHITPGVRPQAPVGGFGMLLRPGTSP
jgi:hypothetical protein